ncbi:DsbE family thiol:disulfide interchange protein [Pseudoxanthomonas sp. SL93]|jgi:cytochrome c biogenesis protein CcmG, thiol:disulfide interchange protein DsbE|uniref:DsbE family thiol:disulfide interchange protein n=1 Tax=Pseudoxanthomonas sp. SL93 TaxID=2995142 RepID=UPI00227207EA|nr:DsbE family thiol:disulfide interchange protein [Pseudoxanthomonas sp. SL93]WAC63657.1 DsbE family thiol:disulfide interchange protein [Pseudoxanthomonas sp. SL93]
MNHASELPPSPPRSRGALTFAVVIIGLFFVGLMGLLYYGVKQSDRPDRESLPSPLIGKPAPAFDLPLLHEPGKRVTPADLAGQPYVMNVWGSWCPECRVEHPVLTKFALTKRVRFVGYNLKDERDDALRWLEQFGNPYMLVIADFEGRTAIDWGIYGAPETFLVDGNGIIRWKHVGAIDDTIIAEQLIPALEKIEAAQ